VGLVLASCSDGSDDRTPSAAVVTSTTVATSVPVAPPSTATTTTVPAAPGATSGPTTTSPASSPEGHAKALFDAWTRGDRAAAEAVAAPEAVAALFARPWQPADGWTFVGCTGAAGSIICTWQRPSGQLMLRVQSMTGGVPVMVSDVRFQP
jgi:hypothetical protein